MSSPMLFPAGGKDIRVFRKTKDAWGDSKAAYTGVTLECVGLAPRTSSSQEGEGFRGRVQSGYTVYLDRWQLEQLQDDDELEVVMDDGMTVYYGLDGLMTGGQWDNPLSFWQPGYEVNLTYRHHAGRA